jgi:protein ImuB
LTDVGGPQRVLVVWCSVWEQAAAPDAEAFEQVVTVVEEFCPQVEVLRPGACAVAVRGPARYFGGEEALAAKIIDAVAGLGFAGQAGIADGLFAAQLAARAAGPGRAGEPAAGERRAGERRVGEPAAGAGGVGEPAAGERVVVVGPGETPAFLAPRPVSSLGDPELADLLTRLGIRTLGEFAALPADAAASRFGTRGAIAHRLARGLNPRPLVPRPPAADLSVSAEFDPPAGQAEPVAFAAKALAERMHAGLAAAGLACVRVRVEVTCADGQEITRLWRHDGLLSALAVAERVRWQLAGWRAARDAGGRDRDKSRPGSRRTGPQGQAGENQSDEGVAPGGITLLRLVPDQLVRATGRQLGLWGDAVVSDRVARAALRVQAMLGPGSVTRPVLAGGRGPADQVTLVPFGDAAEPSFPAGQPWPGRLPAPAPATVYPFPLPARVVDESGAAVTVSGRAAASASPARLSACGGPWLAVTSWAGPWPVTERWWRPASARRKARFQLVTEDGSAWLAVLQDGQWLIEARYE